MVSLDHLNQLQDHYTWMPVLITLASLVTMITTLAYCACCQWLFMKAKTPTINVKSFVPDKSHKYATSPKGTSPATATKVSAPIQEPSTTHRPHTKRKRKTTPPKKTLGRLQVHFAYFKSKSTLEVTVMCAQNLPAKDISGTSDPYCKLLLLPVHDKKLSTPVKFKTLNPVWNETLRFTVSHNELDEQTLYVYILDRDVINQDDMIGECRFNLCNLDLAVRGQTVWREVRHSDGYASHLGEILLSLCYIASQEKLVIGVLKCSNLKAMDANNFSDPYVKLFLWKAGKKQNKLKTKVIMKNRNPVFNQSFSYEISLSQIRWAQVYVEVMDYDRMSSNDKIGCLMLGEHGEGTEAVHWKEMLDNMDRPIAQWHRLHKDVTGTSS